MECILDELISYMIQYLDAGSLFMFSWTNLKHNRLCKKLIIKHISDPWRISLVNNAIRYGYVSILKYLIDLKYEYNIHSYDHVLSSGSIEMYNYVKRTNTFELVSKVLGRCDFNEKRFELFKYIVDDNPTYQVGNIMLLSAIKSNNNEIIKYVFEKCSNNSSNTNINIRVYNYIMMCGNLETLKYFKDELNITLELMGGRSTFGSHKCKDKCYLLDIIKYLEHTYPTILADYLQLRLPICSNTKVLDYLIDRGYGEVLFQKHVSKSNISLNILKYFHDNNIKYDQNLCNDYKRSNLDILLYLRN